MRTQRPNHEVVYQQIAASGGRGWDDRKPEDKNQGSYIALDAFLETLMPPTTPTNALEVGCGGGQAALRLAALGYTVFGIDEAPTAIALAKENAQREQYSIEFCVGDVCMLEQCYAPASMQLIVDNHLLHCIVDPDDRRDFLRGVASTLSADGIFFSETMSCEGTFDPTFVNADPVTRIARSNTRIWIAEKAFDEELEQAGLRIETRYRRIPDTPSGALLVTIARKR